MARGHLTAIAGSRPGPSALGRAVRNLGKTWHIVPSASGDIDAGPPAGPRRPLLQAGERKCHRHRGAEPSKGIQAVRAKAALRRQTSGEVASRLLSGATLCGREGGRSVSTANRDATRCQNSSHPSRADNSSACCANNSGHCGGTRGRSATYAGCCSGYRRRRLRRLRLPC
jgi:hypothetical protein